MAIRVSTNLGQPAAAEMRLKRDIGGFKSCPPDRSAATVAEIEVLLKGFAGARNHLDLEFACAAA
jgi:hypothetical protein